jgi:hypothetical protein
MATHSKTTVWQSAPGRVQALSAEDRRRLLLSIASLLTALGASSEIPGPALPVGDKLLTVQQAAEKLSSTVRNGRRLRFSERGIEQWIMRRAKKIA